MPVKKKVKNKITQKNLIVELYKIKFDKLKPFAEALNDYQSNGIVNIATTYAQGLSNGFDTAIDSFLEVLDI
jgi:hypothetical protein